MTKVSDALQMILAGASTVGIGTAVYYEGIEVFEKINRGIEEYLIQNEFDSIEDLRGSAHE